jgi:uncharacterized membrane-anchored protein
MKEIDIDSVLKAMEKPQTGDNLKNLMELIQKADEFLKGVEGLMSRMDRMGLKPLLVRGMGAKLGIDAESPLKCESSFKSETHRQYVETVNSLSEDELKKFLNGSGGND